MSDRACADGHCRPPGARSGDVGLRFMLGAVRLHRLLPAAVARRWPSCCSRGSTGSALRPAVPGFPQPALQPSPRRRHAGLLRRGDAAAEQCRLESIEAPASSTSRSIRRCAIVAAEGIPGWPAAPNAGGERRRPPMRRAALLVLAAVAALRRSRAAATSALSTWQQHPGAALPARYHAARRGRRKRSAARSVPRRAGDPRSRLFPLPVAVRHRARRPAATRWSASGLRRGPRLRAGCRCRSIRTRRQRTRPTRKRPTSRCRHVARRGADWHYLTGTPDAVAAITAAVGFRDRLRSRVSVSSSIRRALSC